MFGFWVLGMYCLWMTVCGLGFSRLQDPKGGAYLEQWNPIRYHAGTYPPECIKIARPSTFCVGMPRGRGIVEFPFQRLRFRALRLRGLGLKWSLSFSIIVSCVSFV